MQDLGSGGFHALAESGGQDDDSNAKVHIFLSSVTTIKRRSSSGTVVFPHPAVESAHSP
jgi:hypothetical protein